MIATFWLWSSQLRGASYQFWSGIGSDFGEVTLVFGVYLFWRHHNCKVRRCWRFHWHTSSDHDGALVCRKHHPSGHDPTHPLNRR